LLYLLFMRRDKILSYLLTVVSVITITHCRNSDKKETATTTKTGDTYDILSIKVNYPPNNPEDVAQWKGVVQSYFDTVLAPKLNGQILVAKNGEILFERYQGYTAIGTDSAGPIDAHTPLHLASVTKPFTAMAILKLQEAGKLNINDTVGKYLAGFPYPGMTIKMLLNHRSGLLNYVHNLAGWGWPETQMATNEDMLRLLMQFRPPLQAPPDSKFQYCNTNYALLALIIEKASAKPYAQYLKQAIFGPLEMNDTFVFQPGDTAKATPSYDWKGRLIPFNFLDGVYGDKNIYSTVRDLYKWDQALYTNVLFKQSSIDSAFAPYSFEKPGIRNYGLGWRMFLFENGKKITFHNGWWHGNNNAFYRLTQDSATIIVLGNKYSRANYSVLQLSYLFGDYPFEAEADEAAADSSNNSAARDSLMVKLIRQKTDSVKAVRKKPVPVKVPEKQPDTVKTILKVQKDSMKERKK
jgi:CubicO group peptidase (beta-lactamase class C family)